MEIVGLKGYQNQMVGQLSGGMQQRGDWHALWQMIRKYY